MAWQRLGCFPAPNLLIKHGRPADGGPIWLSGNGKATAHKGARDAAAHPDHSVGCRYFFMASITGGG